MVATATAPARDRIMIRFTDAQIEALRELATPLAPFQRGRFLEPVAECLTGITIGDGSCGRGSKTGIVFYRPIRHLHRS
jgi:hypothetical protein